MNVECGAGRIPAVRLAGPSATTGYPRPRRSHAVNRPIRDATAANGRQPSLAVDCEESVSDGESGERRAETIDS